MNRYMGFGSDSFAGVPIVLTNPSAGALATALAGRKAVAYRCLDAGSVTLTDANAATATWTHQVGEGYALPLTDVVAASSRILVFC